MGFKFSDNKIHYEFEGKRFDADAAKSTVWLKETLRVLDDAKIILKGGNEGTELSEDDIERILAEFTESFDKLLGKGASAKIFGERPVSFYDCYDIYIYIMTKIRNFASTKRKEAEIIGNT